MVARHAGFARRAFGAFAAAVSSGSSTTVMPVTMTARLALFDPGGRAHANPGGGEGDARTTSSWMNSRSTVFPPLIRIGYVNALS